MRCQLCSGRHPRRVPRSMPVKSPRQSECIARSGGVDNSGRGRRSECTQAGPAPSRLVRRAVRVRAGWRGISAGSASAQRTGQLIADAGRAAVASGRHDAGRKRARRRASAKN
jgi:hypothetical protein